MGKREENRMKNANEGTKTENFHLKQELNTITKRKK